jgi:serine/threonine-protein kinase
VLFELLTGVTAFDEPSLLELSAAILEREPVPLQTLRPDATAELEDVVLRCLQKDPAQRYQNVAELAAALYPFGPRRARISAERCYHMLKNAGIVSKELELASAYPPPLSSGRITTRSLPTPAQARTTTPAAIDLLVEDDAAPAPSKKGRTLAIFGVLGIAAAAAGLLFVRAHTPASAAAAPLPGTPLSPVPTAVASAPAATPEAPKPTRFMDLDQEAEPAAATKTSPAASPPPRAKQPKTARPAHAASTTGKRPRAGDDDLDPGF